MLRIKEEIKQMYFWEHLTIGEIASALKIDPKIVIKVIREGPD